MQTGDRRAKPSCGPGLVLIGMVVVLFAQAPIAWAMSRPAAATTERHDAIVIRHPDPLILHGGESAEIAFEVQNTGSATWTAGQGYVLANINGESLGASPNQSLSSEIPAGRVVRWVIPLTAPSQIGLNLTEWQMSHAGEPFGERMFCLVMVVPQGERGGDLSASTAQWLDKLGQRVGGEMNRVGLAWTHRFLAWLEDDSEPAVRQFVEGLRERMCGGAVMAPAVVLIGISMAGHTRRRRTGAHGRE